MLRRFFAVSVLAAVPACTLFADFTYEQTTTITGGALMGMMRLAGAFSKQAREPIKSTVMVRGNKMVHVNANTVSIIDLDKETITNIDMQKKQYSVMTFAEMKQFLEEMSQKMKSKDGTEAQFKVTGSATGQTKKIQGLDAKEFVINMQMDVQNEQKGQAGAMNITTHTWLASGVAGYDEVRAFQKRMAEKLAWAPGGGGMMMNRPDIAKGMAQVAKEMAALDGIPVLQLTKMGGTAANGQNAQLTPEQQAQIEAAQQQGAQARQQQEQQQQAQQQQQQPSAGSVLGGALGGRLGRFGGLGRKKSSSNDQQQQPQQQSQSTPPPAASGAPPSDPGVLMETSTELTNFGSGPVDASKFEVPAGFKQVESEMRRRGR